MAKDKPPRISVNKLAEYMGAKGGRQRQILRDQKFPTDYKGMYYREAAEAISKCIVSNLEDTACLDKALAVLGQMSPEKIGTQRRINCNMDAIETFQSMLDLVDLQSATPTYGEHAPEKLQIQNVEISVRPEIILKGKGKSGKTLVGCLKLHFPRTHPLEDDGAGYVSALLQEYCKTHLHDDEAYGPYCFVIDVGAKTVHPGVKATSLRMKDVVNDCRNIAALWPTITPNE